MIELAQVDDPVRLSWMRAVLAEAGIDSAVFDGAASALWPGALRARLMVAARDAWLARKTLDAAEAERLAED
ncbi:MAG: DUF2007 domain-containing protein [Caulobacteraceae bacterium]|nr:DUF2007 domain-containing protein [Caulobacter sp.]